MTYTKCSRCGEVFHLRLTSEQAIDELHTKERNGAVLCIGCFKNLKEYDVVQVISENSDVPEAQVGDKGAVLMMLNNSNGEPSFEVECVLPDGTNKWLGTFKREQLKWLQSPGF